MPGARERQAVGPAFCVRPASDLARALLGTWLISTIDGTETIGRIVETEAYLGADDDASHAAARIGRTRRNAVMFGPAGVAYVYRSYGIHWCMNVVADRDGHASAVLIRAIEPVSGEAVMRRRRGRGPALPSTAIGRGPGNLTVALGISGALNGHPLHAEPLILARGRRVRSRDVAVSPRVGISRAVELPLRYFLRGHPCVSASRSS